MDQGSQKQGKRGNAVFERKRKEKSLRGIENEKVNMRGKRDNKSKRRKEWLIFSKRGAE